MRPARSDRSKNALKASPSAETLFRRCRPDHPAAQPIGRGRADHPSRSGHRQTRAGSAFFRASAEARRERYGLAVKAPGAESADAIAAMGSRLRRSPHRCDRGDDARGGGARGCPSVSGPEERKHSLSPEPSKQSRAAQNARGRTNSRGVRRKERFRPSLRVTDDSGRIELSVPEGDDLSRRAIMGRGRQEAEGADRNRHRHWPLVLDGAVDRLSPFRQAVGEALAEWQR